MQATGTFSLILQNICELTYQCFQVKALLHYKYLVQYLLLSQFKEKKLEQTYSKFLRYAVSVYVDSLCMSSWKFAQIENL